MIKYIMILTGFFFFSTTQVWGDEYQVNVSELNKQIVALSFSTVETQSSICPLSVEELTVSFPSSKNPTLFRPQKAKPGTIKMEVSPDYHALCLQSFGPHQGKINLKRGGDLPSFKNGAYKIIINEQSYGTLMIGETVQLIQNTDA